MCRRICGRRKKYSIPTKNRAAGRLRKSPRGRRRVVLERAEDLLELVRSRDLELIVAAVLRLLVGAPSFEHRGVAKAIALHVVVLHLAYTFDTHRLPRQILSGAPAALTSRHARAVVRVGPLTPRMSLQRIDAKRLEFCGELTPPRHRERRRHANVV